MKSTFCGAACCACLAFALAVSACGKSSGVTSTAPQSPSPGTAVAAAAANAAGNVTAQPSESIATNAADPNCPDCQRPDVTSTKDVTIVPLDPVFRDDLKLTISKTCQVLEDGVAILETHAKQPETAQAALEAYREKNKTVMAELATKTQDMTVRLKALGYESDIPEEVKQDYEERMSKVLARLEVVRAVYAKHPKVLETFGPFIRSAE